MAENKEYNVGYRKPPEQSKFVKGKSGNPKGRPKGSGNLSTLIQKSGLRRVNVVVNGRKKSVTLIEACILQLTQKAVSGDVKTILQFLSLLKEAAEEQRIAIPPPDIHVHFVEPKPRDTSDDK